MQYYNTTRLRPAPTQQQAFGLNVKRRLNSGYQRPSSCQVHDNAHLERNTRTLAQAQNKNYHDMARLDFIQKEERFSLTLDSTWRI